MQLVNKKNVGKNKKLSSLVFWAMYLDSTRFFYALLVHKGIQARITTRRAAGS
ncbi:hypothetical protein [Lederbergia citrea]|uniref:hypothetical protein n=1 Tax=Lederbergia citrea TaxID=2833581 RepID=UPI001BC93C8C|nr:hypothetical protein [Lederbergia citrea]MBS4177587.1 hypothetical protein [Lederbergia citrea]